MHFKILYDNSDGTIQTLLGYNMITDNADVAKDWLESVKPGYPNLALRLNDPAQQAIAEALRISDAGFENDLSLVTGDGDMEEDFDGYYHTPVPYHTDQFGDVNHHHALPPEQHGDIAPIMEN